MLAAIVIFCSSLTFGTIALALLRLRTDRSFTGCVPAVCTGLCIWMQLLFVFGHAGLFKPWLLCGIAFAAALAAPFIVSEPRERLGDILSRVRALTPGQRGYAIVVGSVLLMTFIACFAPVTGGIRNDEICLHLSVVRQWLAAGRISVPAEAISHQAGNAHLLFLLAGAIGGPAGQRLVSWLCFVACLGAIYAISRSVLDKKYSLLATAITAINPLVFRGASVAFVDIQSALFIVMPVLAVQCYRRNRQAGWLILCALFLGTGAGVKPTNIVYAAAFCAASLICYAARRIAVKELLPAAAIVVILGGVFAAPWPIRLLALSGSPVFPPPLALYKNGDLKPLRGGPAPFTYSTVKGYYDYVKSRYGDYRPTLINFLRFPWDLTMNPARFQIGDSIGTVYLCLFPCALLILPIPRLIWLLLLSAMGSAVPLYFFVAPEARYYIGALLLLSPVLAYTARRLENRLIFRIALRAIIIVNCIFSLMVAIRVTGPSIKAAVDPAAAQRMKRAAIPFYEAFEFIRQNRIADIAVLYAPQNLYYLPGPTRYHADGSLLSKLQTLHGTYLLDMDYSQILERNRSLMSGTYGVDPRLLPPGASLIFRGPDARIYRFE